MKQGGGSPSTPRPGQARAKRARPGWIILATAVFVLAAITAVIALGQRQFIYYPARFDPGPAAERFTTGQDVELHTDDGLTLKTWLVEPTTNPPDTAVLYAPGNGGNRVYRMEVAQAIADQGYTVLMLEYRGYGDNPGSPSEEGLASDARAAAAYLREHGFPGDKTIYVGESIGTGVVARLATTDPPAGVLLRSPFSTLVEEANSLAWGLPIGLLLYDRFETTNYITQIAAPVTVLCGKADNFVPCTQSAKVAELAPNLHKFIEVDSVGHNDEIWFGPYLATQVDDLAKVAI
ncbi:MAG: alpha/beta hydrolase [Propionibacteriaceae bacterium]|jgi:fermentation-respiration switch protein FrsA (DUF1100 family)|nr:alpha/beta hydrolase [Propionibacteriaceae bacterium]